MVGADEQGIEVDIEQVAVDELETFVSLRVRKVPLFQMAGVGVSEAIDADDLVPDGEQPVGEVRADEASDAKSARNAAAAQGGLKESAPRALAKRSEAQVSFAFERQLAPVAPEAEPLELTLEPDGNVELYASELSGGLHLWLPVPSGTPEGSLIEVRVAAPEGRREIRERFRLQASQTQLVLSLPPGWITPGTHSIELRVTGATGEDAPRYRSTLAVR